MKTCFQIWILTLVVGLLTIPVHAEATPPGGAPPAAAAGHSPSVSGPVAASPGRGASVDRPAVASAHPAQAVQGPRVLRWIVGTLVGLFAFGAGSGYFTQHVMKHWPVPRRIAGGFAIVLLVLAGLGLGGYEGLHRAVTGFVGYRLDTQNGMLTGRIQANFLEMRLSVKDYQITRNAGDFRTYEERREKTLEFIKEAREAVTDPEHKRAIDSIAEGVARHYALFQQMQKEPDDAAVAATGRTMAGVGAGTDHAIEELKLAFVANQNRVGPVVDRTMQETQAAIACIAVAALALGVFLSWLVGRSIVAPLRVVADELALGAERTATVADQFSASSQTLAQGASEQAASLEETSASIEELTSMVKRNADAAGKAKTLAGETRAAADTGTADMAEMRSAMNDIKTSSAEVAKIVKDIDEIAFQTNILALNAAVEAARAGEAGMGFAVVADEVRSLAQRSAKSARETADKIEDAIAKGERGVQISAKVAASFEQIAGKTREVDRYVAEIATASGEQAQGVSQINTAVSQMDQATQSNTASAEESAAAAEELSSQAESVKESLHTLQQMVGGGAGTATPAASTRSRRAPTSSKLPAPRRSVRSPAPVGAQW